MNGYPLAAMAGWGVLCAAIGFAVAWNSKPTSVQDRIVSTEIDTSTVGFSRHVDIQVTRASAATTRVVTRWVPSPAGPVVERVEETAQNALEERHAASEEQSVRIEYREKLVEHTRTVETARSQWRAGALVSTGLDWQRVYGAAIERRIAGPLWLGIEGRTDRTAAIRAALEW